MRVFLPLSRVLLILANLVPLLGVFLLRWEVFPLLYLYWLENAVIGLFAVLRILTARGPRTLMPPDLVAPLPLSWSTLFHIPLALFFIVHYGMFTMVHGILLRSLFGDPPLPLAEIVPFAAALFLSHGYSFWTNYLGRREYLQVSASDMMHQPYKRVIVMHLTVLLGGFLAATFRHQEFFLILLIALKTAVDLAAHAMEHRRLAQKGGV